jgi:hypothetical protein
MAGRGQFLDTDRQHGDAILVPFDLPRHADEH